MEKLCRLACIMRNPPEEDDDVEQIRNTTLPVAAIEGPPMDDSTTHRDQYDRNRY